MSVINYSIIIVWFMSQTAEKANELHCREWYKNSYEGIRTAAMLTVAPLSGEARESRSRTMKKMTKVSRWRFWQKKGTVSEAREVKVEKVG